MLASLEEARLRVDLVSFLLVFLQVSFALKLQITVGDSAVEANASNAEGYFHCRTNFEDSEIKSCVCRLLATVVSTAADTGESVRRRPLTTDGAEVCAVMRVNANGIWCFW